MIRRYDLTRSDNAPYIRRKSFTTYGSTEGFISINTGFIVSNALVTWSSIYPNAIPGDFYSTSSSSSNSSNSSSSSINESKSSKSSNSSNSQSSNSSNSQSSNSSSSINESKSSNSSNSSINESKT